MDTKMYIISKFLYSNLLSGVEQLQYEELEALNIKQKIKKLLN